MKREMREIKFRAWDREKKKLVGPFEVGSEASMLWLPEMQYTGLKDKNGKEIYDGDITTRGIVEWCECLNWDSGGSNHPGFYFKDRYEHNERGCLAYHDGFDEDIEVIGNIYENPELLKVKYEDVKDLVQDPASPQGN